MEQNVISGNLEMLASATNRTLVKQIHVKMMVPAWLRLNQVLVAYAFLGTQAPGAKLM